MALGIPLTPPRGRFPRQEAPPEEPPAGGGAGSGGDPRAPIDPRTGLPTTRAPLGVPEDFQGPRRSGPINPSTGQRGNYKFREGDEFTIARMPSEQRAKYQKLMEQAGLLAPGSYRLGDVDNVTLEAWAMVLGYANQNDWVSWDEALMHLIQGAEEGGFDPTGEGERPPLVTRLSNPDELKALADDVARNSVYGRELTEDEKARFVQSYQQMEADSQAQVYGMDETGGTFTGIASPEVAIESRLRAERPDEAFAHDWADRYESFLNLLAGSGL
jgi:hypothetical protein